MEFSKNGQSQVDDFEQYNVHSPQIEKIRIWLLKFIIFSRLLIMIVVVHIFIPHNSYIKPSSNVDKIIFPINDSLWSFLFNLCLMQVSNLSSLLIYSCIKLKLRITVSSMISSEQLCIERVLFLFTLDSQ